MMKISTLYLTVILCSLFSCQSGKIRNLSFEGEFTAKKIVALQCDFPDDIEDIEYNWYIGSSQEGEWEKLQGIWTNELILLTSYVDKYVRCEVICQVKESEQKISASVISATPVDFKGNPNADWFRDAGFGIMIHYLKPVIVPEGGSKEWNEAVNSFNTEEFASQAHSAGVGFVLLTLGQNSGYYCSPNASFDRIVGVNPGDLCAHRDLPMDLIKELKKYDIPLILYLPSNPPINNRRVSEKFNYPYQNDSATSQFNQPILEDMIREWSLRYGTGIKGWWFDGLYSWNSIRSTRMDMSLKHNISTHTLAAKAGNRQSIVTYNSGFGKIQVNTPYCDYSSGEKSSIDELPSTRWVADGVQWFLFTYLGERWGGKGQQFDTGMLVEKAENIVNNEGVLCLEVVTDAKGDILPHHLEQIKAVGKKLGKIN